MTGLAWGGRVRCYAKSGARGALIVFAGVLTGCSFIAPQTQSLSITTIPAGAKVSVNGASAGITPLTTTIPRGHSSVLVAEKRGYVPAIGVTTTRVSAVGVVDIVGAALIIAPIVGIMSDGFYEQKPNNVVLTLQKEEGAGPKSRGGR